MVPRLSFTTVETDARLQAMQRGHAAEIALKLWKPVMRSGTCHKGSAIAPSFTDVTLTVSERRGVKCFSDLGVDLRERPGSFYIGQEMGDRATQCDLEDHFLVSTVAQIVLSFDDVCSVILVWFVSAATGPIR